MTPDLQHAEQWITEARQRGRPEEAWVRICREVLTPGQPFDLHLRLYQACYGPMDAGRPLGPAWVPDEHQIHHSNIGTLLNYTEHGDYAALHRFFSNQRELFWDLMLHLLDIRLRKRFEHIVDLSRPTRPRWLVGAEMNIVESCFREEDAGRPAIVTRDRRLTYAELHELTARFANGLADRGIGPGDAVAFVCPMTAETVAAYLGTIAAGAAAVSIADSFAPDEIATRLRIAPCKLLVTQEALVRGGKRLPLYQRVAAAGAPPAVVIPLERAPSPKLRPGDVTLVEFLSSSTALTPVPRSPQDPINILFSSGTTGDPKAIPWDHTTPIKCASDAWFHHDIHRRDVLCWPTNLGWMMGPWLIFATLINRATMALYDDVPTAKAFGQFVQEAGVTMLGLVPSLVRAWRESRCMEGLDWSAIKCFSSTGECSNPQDMLYLMHLAGYRPVIEYCGGTEIGGAYITGTVVQPCIPATFTTPAMGLDFVILDEDQHPADKGEVYIVGPSMGLSTRLLNRDHEAVYFAGTPTGPNGIPLRRHGDDVERLPNGYYRVVGRSDDTMNLGGIKVGCAEIERVLNLLPDVQETAAVAVPPPGGGPSDLVIYAVLRPGSVSSVDHLKSAMQQAIRDHLNPLFKVHDVVIVPSLPRTASNKVIRRQLRAR